jgi:chromate transporter
LIVLAAGAYGFWKGWGQPTPPIPAHTNAPRPLRTLAIWGVLWASPLLVLWLLDESFLVQLGLFFSKLAVVTFGGAYAVLAYMTQTVVQEYGWITTPQMIDALGLAETTPGPLILVTEFVALLAGFAESGWRGGIAAGTFTPCILWIFLAGPYLEQISASPRLSSALSAITAAVVGVIANLSLWFALHVMFTSLNTLPPLALPWPIWSSFNLTVLVLTVIGAVLMLWFKRGFVQTMLVLAALALLSGLL